MRWSGKIAHRGKKGGNQMQATGENNNGASDQDADARSQVEVLRPQGQEPLVAQVHRVVCVQGVSLATYYR